MACDKHGLVSTTEEGIYRCINCDGEFAVTAALPRCQYCGERKGGMKIHTDMGFFVGVIHQSCKKAFQDTCQEVGYDEAERERFFKMKQEKWQNKHGQMALL